ncbi:hypothetical protein OOT46_22970 [Aquabacterium sp. A7-Y]|uniref:pilus assembly protein TadG-related protein n=1 Tax=Aquabacterium sp. A7-Y TaxID=1349605 RepID=UPI00223E0F9A|nr:pilus assembly protein TadG-related protein [Aquabacterium sp. A7-Y]MCW7540685.1 hypothetical protein [Aquabacterium sp. A7-Y]
MVPIATPARQRGQAMLLGLFVLIIGAGMLFFLFNSGQLLRERVTATNAADAAAYSAGQVMARVMNFEAYSNRAVMANSVAIGQLTALASWNRYVVGIASSYDMQSPGSGEICERFCFTAKGLLPLAGTYGGNAVLEAYTGVDVFEIYRTYIAPILDYSVPALIFTSNGISNLRMQPPGIKDVLLGTLPVARRQAVQDVVDRNYEGFGPARGTGVLVEDTFFSFQNGPMIRRYRGDERERLRATVQAAAYKDPFVEARSFERKTLFPTCVGANGAKFDELKRGGGTKVGLDDWEAIDTSAWHEKYLRKGKCRSREVPLGYGAGEAGGEEGLSTTNMGGSGANKRTASWAESNATSMGYTGLPAFYELSAEALTRERPAARFAVRVNRASNDLHVTGRAAQTQPSGSMELMGPGGTRSMAALSAVEVYFERLTPRDDGRDELASLFNPFWHARLVSPGIGAIAETLSTQ